MLETEPDATGDRVAVLSNLGAGLIGLSKGQTIRWADRVGGVRELTIVDVLPRQATAARPEDAPRAPPGKLQREAMGEVVPFRRALRSADPEGEEPPPSAA